MNVADKLIEMKIELDHMPTTLEYIQDYIGAFLCDIYDLLSPDVLTQLALVLGTITILLASVRWWRRRGNPNVQQWSTDNDGRMVRDRQSKMMNQPNVRATTTYVHCVI